MLRFRGSPGSIRPPVPNILEAAEHQEMLRKLVRSSGLILLCFAIGIAGYTIVGGDKYGFVDALYMTIITLTTVGYGEAIDLSHGPGGKLFTSFLLMFGVGSFIYFFSTLTAFIEARIRLVTEQMGAPFPYVVGDATMDSALLAAGLSATPR